MNPRRLLAPLAALALVMGVGLIAGPTAALGALAMALLLLPLKLATERSLSRLEAVRRGMDALARGERLEKLAADGGPEVAGLIRSFNTLADAVSARTDQLQQNEARFHALAESAFGMEAWFNDHGKLLWVNPSVERATGYSVAECILAPDAVELLVYPKDQGYARELLQKALRGEASDGQEIRLLKKDGEVLWVGLNWQLMTDAAGGPRGLRISVSDVERRKQAELKLLETVAEVRRAQSLQQVYLRRSDEERKRLEALLDAMRIGVLFLDDDRRVLHCNRAFLVLLGFSPDENLTGVRVEVILENCADLISDAATYRQHLESVLAEQANTASFEFSLNDGRIIAEVTAPVPGPSPDGLPGHLWIYEDVTEQRRAAERLTQLADRDPLTNLLNRRRFHEELQRMLAEADRRRAPFGLLAIDLDGFKGINDRFGHQAGDDVLTTLAHAVGSTVRKNEIFFRLGGDEFAILAPDSGEAEMLGLARRVSGIIVEQRWQFDGVQVGITASMGIAIYPQDASDGEELIAHADTAMYQAKGSGRNAWQMYRGTGVGMDGEAAQLGIHPRRSTERPAGQQSQPQSTD